MIAECESEILWGLCRVIFVSIISVYLVFWSTFIRNLMMTVFIYSMVHDILFQSYLFHSKFYESFQELFEGEYAHWSKIMIEIKLFYIIFIYIIFVTFIVGSFGAAMSITFACYLIVKNTVSTKYEPYKFGDGKSEFMNICAWSFFFVISVIVQWKFSS